MNSNSAKANKRSVGTANKQEEFRKKQKDEEEAREKAYAEKHQEFEDKMNKGRSKIKFFIPAAANISGKDIVKEEEEDPKGSDEKTHVTRISVLAAQGIYLYIFSPTNRVAVGIMFNGIFDEWCEPLKPLSFHRFSCYAATVSVVCPKMVDCCAPQGGQWKVEGGEPKVNDNGTWTFDLVWEGFGKQKISVTMPNPLIG